jgi:Holliday junction resolvase RusA-like endonuclease
VWGVSGQLKMTFPGLTVARFGVPGDPTSKARARFTGRGYASRAYTPAATHEAERMVATWFKAYAPLDWTVDKDRAFGVDLVFKCATWHRRDLDNMTKLVLDALNKVCWQDDMQVTRINSRVERGVGEHRASTWVHIWEAGDLLYPTRDCLFCGQPFRVYKSQSQRFCKRQCGHDYRKANRTRECIQCGEQFVARSDASEQKFCGPTCSAAHGRLRLTCTYCGTEFERARSLSRIRKHHFCRHECEANYWRETKQRNARGTCDACGGPTSKKSYRLCRACRVSERSQNTTAYMKNRPVGE